MHRPECCGCILMLLYITDFKQIEIDIETIRKSPLNGIHDQDASGHFWISSLEDSNFMAQVISQSGFFFWLAS